MNDRELSDIKSTLKHWYQGHQIGKIENKWVSFNGVEIICTEVALQSIGHYRLQAAQQLGVTVPKHLLSSGEWRVVGSVTDIATIMGIGENGFLTVEQWLDPDYLAPTPKHN